MHSLLLYTTNKFIRIIPYLWNTKAMAIQEKEGEMKADLFRKREMYYQCQAFKSLNKTGKNYPVPKKLFHSAVL